jgi:hypothetical protein
MSIAEKLQTVANNLATESEAVEQQTELLQQIRTALVGKTVPGNHGDSGSYDEGYADGQQDVLDAVNGELIPRGLEGAETAEEIATCLDNAFEKVGQDGYESGYNKGYEDGVAEGGGGTGDVGGLTQHTKIYITPDNKNQFDLTNPLGGFAKKVSITCPPNCATETTKGMIQKYILDTDSGIGAMYYLHATNGNLVCSGALQAETPANAKYVVSDGEIIMRSYGSTNGMWDADCEYEIEIWQ